PSLHDALPISEFIHGKPKCTQALIGEAGIQTVVTAGDPWEIRKGKVQRTRMFPETLETVADALGALRTDTTMKEFLDENFPQADFPELWEDARNLIEGFDAADLGRISARAIHNEWSADSEFYRRATRRRVHSAMRIPRTPGHKAW